MIAALLAFGAPAAAAPHDPMAYTALPAVTFLAPVTIYTDTQNPELWTSGSRYATGVWDTDHVAVFAFDSVTFAQNVVLEGRDPVAILSRGDLSFTFGIFSTQGASGGGPVLPGEGTGGGFPIGGGGGFGGDGGMATGVGAGFGGIAYGDLTVKLEGGSGGAGGTLRYGGIAGAGLELGAAGRIFVDGPLDLAGAPGLHDGNLLETGSGGGSGGALLAHAGRPGSNCTEGIDLRGGDGGFGGFGESGGGGAGGRALYYGLPAACGVQTTVDGGTPGGASGEIRFAERDHDGDGLSVEDGDCDDYAAAAKPGGTESCDGIDNDCDGATDEDAGADWFFDADGDTWGAGAPQRACPVAGPGTGTDCDDGNSGIRPGAQEVCDGIDQDCAGGPDDGLAAVTSYPDPDLDGYGADTAASVGCAVPPAYVLLGGDCEPLDRGVHPGEPERCDGLDQNCAGGADEGLPVTTYWTDLDHDGWGIGAGTSACAQPPDTAFQDGDCDDVDPTRHPNQPEQCDGDDDDCDGQPDDGVVNTDWYLDADADGYGSGAPISACAPPPGHVDRAGDCNDGAATVHPAAGEVCNTVDDDCNGVSDDGLPFLEYFPDQDGDGRGRIGPGVVRCAPSGSEVSVGGDCDDADPAVRPGVAELGCDGLDNDCDPVTPDQEDRDGDGYPSCLDCDDGSDQVFPGRPEIACNGADDDCDGATADDPGDVDGDGFLACVDDCADRDPAVPGAAELACNSVDDDCDPLTPDGPDADGDGSAAAPCGSDCDDADPARYPGATERCDGVDEDCSGVADDGFPILDWFEDLDGDGVGGGPGVASCAPVPGRVADGRDCDDADADVWPGNVDPVCDGVDNDCDALGTPDRPDGDGDGASACEDCDDAVPTRSPDLPELPCNGVDDDCLGDATSDTPDADGDGLGACGGDCDDADPGVPTLEETCTGVDEDCNPASPDEPDADGDGVDGCEDCDDADADVFPGAPDFPGDGVDQDCDGLDASEPGDTGPADTSDPLPGVPLDATVDRGCGCDGAGGIPWPWLALVGAATASRRRGSDRAGRPGSAR